MGYLYMRYKDVRNIEEINSLFPILKPHKNFNFWCPHPVYFLNITYIKMSRSTYVVPKYRFYINSHCMSYDVYPMLCHDI